MGTDFVLVTRVLIDVWRNQDRKSLLFHRQRYRAFDGGTGALGRFDDLTCRALVGPPYVRSAGFDEASSRRECPDIKPPQSWVPEGPRIYYSS